MFHKISLQTASSSFLLIFSLVLFVSCNKQVENSISKIDEFHKGISESEEESEADNPEEASLQNVLMTCDPVTGVPPVTSLESVRSLLNGSTRIASNCVSWQERGPGNVGGRTRAIAYDPSDATHKKVWAGGVSGGLWYTLDITQTNPIWVSVNDFWTNIAIGCITFDPTNYSIIYVGTGEPYFKNENGRGAGIWRSIDNGSSWTRIAIPTSGSSTFNYVQKIVINSLGEVFAGTKNGGVQKYSGAGTSWSQILGSSIGPIGNLLSGGTVSSPLNDVADLEIAADGTMFASIGMNTQTDGIYRSVNNGLTWIRISDSNTGCGFATIGTYSRTELACAPSDANRIYAIPTDFNTNSRLGIYRSIDKGANWVLTAAGIPNDQNGYDVTATVDPFNRDIVYLNSTTSIYYSTNSGDSWSARSVNVIGQPNYVHADQQVFVFKPGSSSELLVGSDGGLSYSNNINSSGFPVFSTKNGAGVTGYRTSQFYSCAINPDAGSNYLMGGTQDNDVPIFSPGAAGLSNSQSIGFVSDGGYCFIDKSGTDYRYIASQQFANYRSSTSGLPGTFTTILANHGPSGRFINPADYDYVNHILYICKNVNAIERIDGIFGTSTQTLISVPSMTNFASVIKVSPYSTVGNTILFLATGPDQFAPSATSLLWRIDNANTVTPTFTSITPPLTTSGAYISCIELGAPNQILLTYSNYNISSVWESLNGGSTWTLKEGNLPDMPIRWALYNPLNRKEVLLATEVGVWSTQNITVSSPDWGMTNSPIVNTRIDMIRYRASDNQVLVATYGRGLFSTCFFNHPNAAFIIPTVGGCDNTSIHFIDQSTNSPTSWSWDFGDPGSGANNLSTLQNPTHHFSGTGTFNISLTVSNASGCNTFSQIIIVQSQPSCCSTFGTNIGQSNFIVGPPISGNYDLFEASKNIDINVNVTLNNAHIAIPEGYSITVKAGTQLEILNGCELFACNKMWKGIIVEPGGRVVIRNSSIRDAQYGLLVQPPINSSSQSSFVSVFDNSEFIDNYIGIYSPEPLIGVTNYNSLQVGNSSFTGLGQLRAPFVGQYPLPLTHPLAGILLERLLNFSINANRKCSFQDMNFGIYTINSNLIIDQSKFFRIKVYDNYTQFGHKLGAAIYCDQNAGSFQLVANGSYNPVIPTDPDFVECKTAIRSFGCDITSERNYISNCDIGIYVSKGKYLKIGIKDNFIDCNSIGIGTVLNDANTSALISNNSIQAGQHNLRVDGLAALASGIVASDFNTINQNTIINLNNINLFDYGNIGIDLGATTRYIVNFNYVTLHNSYNIEMKGLRSLGSQSNLISCNSIAGTNTNPMDYDSPDEIGMFFQDSYANEIKCNTTTNTSNGYVFSANCAGGPGLETIFRNNDIGNHYNGLNYTESAEVDEQKSKGNLWYLNNYLGNGAINSNPNPLTVAYELYYIDAAGPSFPPNTNFPSPISVAAGIAWFIPVPDRDENCGTVHHGECNYKDGEGGPGNFNRDNLIALDLINNQVYEEQSKWKSKVALYEKLLIIPEYRDSSVDLANFYASMAGTTIQNVAALNVEKGDLYPNQSSLISAIENNSISIYNKSNDLLTLDLILSSDSLEELEKDSIYLVRQVIVTSIGSLVESNKISWDALMLSVSNKVDLLSQANDLNSGSEIFHQNEKVINDIYFRAVVKNEIQVLFNSAGAVLAIAEQCPLAGGLAVYRARTLYSLIDPEHQYNDANTCLQNGWMLRKKPVKSREFTLYPNPASSTITLKYEIETKMKLQVFDLLGHLLMEKDLDKESNEVILNIVELNPGIYNYKIVNSNSIEENHGQFTIVK